MASEMARMLHEMDYERLRQLACPAPPAIPTSYVDKIHLKRFSLSEIERLTDALSLSISNPEERISFDNIVRNWRDDRVKEIS